MHAEALKRDGWAALPQVFGMMRLATQGPKPQACSKPKAQDPRKYKKKLMWNHPFESIGFHAFFVCFKVRSERNDVLESFP